MATLQQSSRTLADVDAFGLYAGVTYAGDRETRAWPSVTVGPGFFRALGAVPAVGRLIDERDMAPDAPAAVVISYAIWQEEFGGDPAVVGRVLRLNDTPHVVAGVTAREFVSPARAPQLWMPLDLQRINDARALDRRMLQAVGRLAPGATVAQANAELAALVPPGEAPESGAASSRWVVTAVPVRDAIVGDVRPVLLVVMGAAILVLALVGVNVAGLNLTRAMSRRRLVAVRTALGATRWQAVRPLVAEAIVLSVAGGMLGLLMAVWGQDALVALGGRVLPRTGPPPAIDGTVLMFAALTALATACVVGVVPALVAARGNLSEALTASGRGLAGGHVRAGRLLVAGQMALAVLLLVGAGLLGRALFSLERADVGYSSDRHVLSFIVSLPSRAYPDPPARAQFFAAWLEHLRAVPGVRDAGMISVSPWNGWNHASIKLDGQSGGGTVPLTRVSDGYFQAVGTPVLAGRTFTAADREGTEPVAVVSERLARQWWPNDNPLGKRLQVADTDGVWRTVIGVVGDVRETPSGEYEPGVYLSSWQAPVGGYEILVRLDSDASELLRSIRRELRAVDSSVPVVEPRTMAEVVSSSLAGQRLPTFFTSAFALLAAVLAVVGMYGVMAYAVALRTREFAIRAALGGSRGTITKLVLVEGLSTAVAGTLAGALAAMAGAGILGRLLYGVSARDPITFAGAAGLLLAASAIACLVPAHRATRVSPVDALRSD